MAFGNSLLRTDKSKKNVTDYCRNCGYKGVLTLTPLTWWDYKKQVYMYLCPTCEKRAIEEKTLSKR